MVPYTTILIPLYILLGWIGLQNSLIGLGLVLAMFQLPFGLFMMRNSFEALPVELEEAALIDGCTPTGALRRVLLRGVAARHGHGRAVLVPGRLERVRRAADLPDRRREVHPAGGAVQPPVAATSARSTSARCSPAWSPPPCRAWLVFLLLQRYYVRGFTSGALKG